MKKYIVWAETDNQGEVWYLVNATSEKRAEQFVLMESDVVEIRASGEVKSDGQAGISHRFKLVE